MVRCHVFIALFLAVAMPAALLPSSSSSAQSISPPDGQTSDASNDTPEAGNRQSQGFGLLRIPEVQNDLELTEGQKVQILVLSMEERETRSEMNKKLTEILNPKQLERLKEIRLQVGGPAVFNNYDVIMALKLTWQQRSTLKDIQKQTSEQIKKIFQEIKGLTADERQAKKPEILRRLEQVRQEMSEKGLNVLTAEQKAKFSRMQGKKLKFASSPREP